MGWEDTIGAITGFIDRNKSWLEPVAKIGIGALNQNNTDNAQSQYLQYLRDREAKNYQDQVAAINAYNEQGAAAAGARSAAAASRTAAARATEANRQAAAKKANKESQKMYKKLLEMYKPYKDTADRLLPQMTQTYENSLGMQNAMAQFLNRPEQTAKLNASVPSWMVNVPLPDEVKLK